MKRQYLGVQRKHKGMRQQSLQTWKTGAQTVLPVPCSGSIEFLRDIMTSQRQGNGCLPHCLGLSEETFREMLVSLFPNEKSALLATVNNTPQAQLIAERSELRQQLLVIRGDESEELRALLVSYRAGVELSEIWMADIVTAACMGSDHLWRDLGLPNRGALNGLLRLNFPGLVAENSDDMKWKKFLYRKLCETGGDYVCRSPSCEQCVSYDDCFGSEEH